MPRSMAAVDRLRTIINTQHAILSCEGLDDVLQQIVRAAQDVTQGDAAAVEMVDGEHMAYRAASGSASAHIGLRLSRAASLSGRCVLERKAIRCDDSETDPRVDAEACRKVSARSMVVVPLYSHDVPIGVLKTMSSRPDAFDEIDVEGMDLLSGLATSQIVRAEDRANLAASEYRFRALVESANDAMLVTDASDTILMSNPSAERAFGYASLVGVPLSHLLSERYRAEHARVFATHRAATPTPAVARTIGLEGLRAGGSPFPIELNVSTWRTANNELRLTYMIRDVSERSLLERQVHISARLASVGTLAAGVAHEINNPLACVLANLDMAIEQVGGMANEFPSGCWQDLSDMLVDGRQGAERVRKIVRELKTFSRSDSERRIVVDVHAVVDLALNLTFHVLRNRARIVKDFGRIPPVEADDALLGQVFANVFVNAAHALPDGNPERNEVRISTRTDAQGRAVVEIRDTGCGIPGDVLDRVFDPFFTTKPIGAGMGLGLAVCHNIVSGMGGEITVTSEVGRGTCVRVTLPAAPTMTSAPEPALAPRPAGGLARVLVVDDEPGVALSFKRILRDHEVTCVQSGVEALRLLAAGQRFDVIFSDLMMPQMSGAELFDEIARRFPEHAPSVVFATGGAFTPAMTEFLERVPNERIEKPFDVRGVRALVARRLQR